MKGIKRRSLFWSLLVKVAKTNLLIFGVGYEFLEHMSARRCGDVNIITKSGSVRAGTRERSFLGAELVCVGEGEDSLRVFAKPLAKSVHQLNSVARVHRHMVASIVPDVSAWETLL